jgi:undecaprenyl-diphosphatase
MPSIEQVNTSDIEVLAFFNQFSQQSELLDKAVFFISGCQLLKGGVLVAIFWWAWFEKTDLIKKRDQIISAMISSFMAMLAARILASALPFRQRPIQDGSLLFLRPLGMGKTTIEEWSSFPSDHAVLFFALSQGIYFVSWKAGIFAFVYTVMVIALPRIYLGLHYPIDIFAGAVLGITMVMIGNKFLTQSKPLKRITNFSSSNPEMFYPLFFLLTYQIADMFEDTRHLVRVGYKLFQSSF